MSKNSKINFDGNHNLNGVQVPSGLITIGATEAYKLLEAFNIDWKNIEIPWATHISKWNGAGVDFSETNYKSDIDSATAAWKDSNTTDNKVDWLDPYYDYLDDNGFYTLDGDNKVYSLPNWATTGKISGSEDIVDIINYLIWRTAALDFYTKNWDSRKTTPNSFYVINYPDPANNLINLEGSLVSSIDNAYGLNIDDRIAKIQNCILNPRADRMFETTDGVVETMCLGIITPSNGKINANQNNPDGLSIGNGGDYLYTFLTINDQGINITYFYFPVNLNINNLLINDYKSVNEYFNEFKTFIDDNTHIFNKFDPSNIYNLFKFKQLNSSGLEISYTEQDIQIDCNIEKANNQIINLYWNNNNLVTLSKIENFGLNTINNEKISVAKYVSDVGAVKIPYKLNRQDWVDEYNISFELKYGYSFGIYPYFFIKDINNHVISTDYQFDPDTHRQTSCSYGSGDDKITINITYNNSIPTCTFIPCEKKQINTEIKICCLFYYSDDDQLRAVNPTYAEFNVLMQADQKNCIKFAYETAMDKWDSNNHVWIRDTGITASDLFKEGSTYCEAIIKNGEQGVQYEGVPYAVVSISYNSIIDGELNLLKLGNIVNTYCSNERDLQISLLGAIKSTTYDFSSWDGTTTSSSIIYNEELKIGESNNKNNGIKDGTFYSYIGNDAIGSLSIYDGNTTISTTYASKNIDIPVDISFDDISLDADYINSITDLNNRVSFRNARDIKSSSAIYPNDNGLIKVNGVWHDSDNEYYYLVFKIYSPDGVNSSFSYSECKAYLFVRILRGKNESILSLTNLSPSGSTEVEYTIGEDNTTYSTRNQVRNTIFLNRLLDSSSQAELKKYSGKRYWYIGVPIGGPTQLNEHDDNIAINNKLVEDADYGEEFVKIFNEGDKYPKTIYSAPLDARKNLVNEVKYENTSAIVNGWTSKSDYNTKLSNYAIVGKYESTDENDTTKSGAILFVNKLWTAKFDNSDNVIGYVKKDNLKSNNTISLLLGIGNDGKFSRRGFNTNEQPFTFTIPIYPMEYDIKLGEMYNNNIVPLVNSLNNPITLDLATQSVNYPITFSPTTTKVGKFIYLLSNAFGGGTSDSNTIHENQDKLEVLYNGEAYIHIVDEYGYDFNAKINVHNESDSSFSNWYCEENSGTSTYPSDVNTNDAAILIYPAIYNGSASSGLQVYRAFQMFPQDSKDSHMYVHIYNDPFGIYEPLNFNIYYSVSGQNSSAEPQEG